MLALVDTVPTSCVFVCDAFYDTLWWYITNAVDRGIESYDLAGANNPRLSRYKAKFAPDLATYYRTERGSWPTMAATKLYGKFR